MPPQRTMPVLVCVAAALFSAEARAEGSVTLTWTAPAECPTPAEVRAEIDRLLGKSKAQAPLEVAVTVTRTEAGRHRAKLEIKGEDGPRTREVDAGSCAAVSDAAALIIAMTIDPAAALAAPPPKSTAKEPAAEKPAAEKPAADNPAPAGQTSAAKNPETPPQATGQTPQKNPGAAEQRPTPRASVEVPGRALSFTKTQEPPHYISHPGKTSQARPPFAVLARAGVDIGTLPQPSLALGVALAVLPDRFRFELGAIYFPARRSSFETLSPSGGDVDLFLGHATACVTLAHGKRLDFAPCLGLELGRVHAASFGVSSPGEGAAPWVAASADARLSTQLTEHVSVITSLEGAVPLVRPEFIVSGLGTVHLPSPVVGRLALGIEMHF